MPPFRTSNDVFALNQFIAGRKLESQLIRPEISCLGVNRYDVRGLRRSMMASTAARRRSNSGRSRLSRSSARHPRPRLPNPKLVSRRIARRVARLRSLPSTPPLPRSSSRQPSRSRSTSRSRTTRGLCDPHRRLHPPDRHLLHRR